MSNVDLLGKSPKMWVNEICVKQLTQAKWDTKDAFPGQSPPTFICKCIITYSDRVLEAEATGKTKKDAEQEAARRMLFEKLEMTPAQLLSLNSNAKKKEASHPSPSISDSKDGGGGGDHVMGEDDVSDTDDNELNGDINPIGFLIAICSVNDLEEPEYYEVNVEGPPHKRVFTMGCSMKDLNIEETGRRHKKQTAKKLAALRVLRKVQSRGYEYNPFAERSVEKEGNPGSPSTGNNKDITNPELHAYLEKLTTDTHFQSLVGSRGYCNDTSEKCLQFCVDYRHAFHHLTKSDTLDEIIKNPECVTEGSLSMLKKVANELEIRLVYWNPDNLKTPTVFIGMKFPFNFNIEVPNKSVVHGVGSTVEEAKTDAAKNAINFLKMMMVEN